MKISLKNCNVDSDKEYFLEVDIQYSENLDDLLNDFPILPERINIEKLRNLRPTYIIKKNMSFTKEI